MFGAIYGDIVGSKYEFNPIKTKDFSIISDGCRITDDTGMTLAVAKTLNECDDEAFDPLSELPEFKRRLIDNFHEIGNKYPLLGYGPRFSAWLSGRERTPYFSFGNGSAMRVSPTAYFCSSPEETRLLARASAEITHNHPEGIKGAECTAQAVFLALHGSSKEELRSLACKYYTMDFSLDEVRPSYGFDVSCQGSVPFALEAFLEADGFEDTIRNCVSLGGDSDTLAAIAGAVAEAFYTISEKQKNEALSFLDPYLSDIALNFEKKFMQK